MIYENHFIPLSPCTFLRVSGPDRLRFLNGQVTNDVRLATPTRAIYSAVLDAKGRLEAVCFIREHDGSYLLDAPLELRDTLFARLDRYLIADEVELTDESERWHLFHHLDAPDAELTADYSYASDRLVPGRGWEALLDDPKLAKNVKPRLTPECVLAQRLELGLPAWGAELTPGLLPAEAGLDRTAVSFEKGCYLGQEVVSRMKRAGKTNRHLVQLELSAAVAAPLPALLLADGAEAGVVTSTAPVPGSSALAGLGFRKRKFEEAQIFDVAHPDRSASGVQARVVRSLS